MRLKFSQGALSPASGLVKLGSLANRAACPVQEVSWGGLFVRKSNPLCCTLKGGLDELVRRKSPCEPPTPSPKRKPPAEGACYVWITSGL